MDWSWEDLERRARRLNVDRTQAWKYLQHIKNAFPDRQAAWETVEYYLSYLEAFLTGMLAPLTLGPLPRAVSTGKALIGDAITGVVTNNRLCLRRTPVTLDASHFLQNILVCGMMGVGKTCFMMVLGCYCRRGILFDREGEYLPLAAARPDIVALHYLNGFKHNPFFASHLPTEQREPYELKVAEVVSGKSGLFDGSHSVLVHAILTLDRNGRQQFGPTFVLTLNVLLAYLQKRVTEGRLAMTEKQYHERVIARLSLLNDELGDVFNTPNSMLPYLLDRFFILDLSGLSDRAAAHLANLIHVFHQFSMPVMPRVKLRALRLIDEGHVFASKADSYAGENPFATGFLRDRKRGCGNIYATQNPALIHELITNNCRTRVYFCQGSTQEAEAAARDLFGSEMTSQHVQAIQFLPPRFSFIKHPECRVPLLVRIRRVIPPVIE